MERNNISSLCILLVKYRNFNFRVQWKGKEGMSQEKKEYGIIAPTSKG